MATSPEQMDNIAPDFSEADHDDSALVFEDFERIEQRHSALAGQERRTFYEHVIDALKRVPDGTYCEDVSDIYNGISGDVILRREHPVKVFDAIFNNTPLRVHSDEGALNATHIHGAKDVSSLHNPFIEGFSHVEGVVTVLGFIQGDELRKVEANRLNEHMKEKSVVTDRDISIDGLVRPSELVFVIVRLPSQYVPDGELSPAEEEAKEEGKLQYVFRGSLLNSGSQTNDLVH